MDEADELPEADPTVSVRRRIERDDLAALIRASEQIHGPITAAEIQAAREEMLGRGAHGEPA
jgi:hypothetical protein